MEEAKEQQVSLLVVGKEKKPPVWRLLKRWGWKKRPPFYYIVFCKRQHTACVLFVDALGFEDRARPPRNSQVLPREGFMYDHCG